MKLNVFGLKKKERKPTEVEVIKDNIMKLRDIAEALTEGMELSEKQKQILNYHG